MRCVSTMLLLKIAMDCYITLVEPFFPNSTVSGPLLNGTVLRGSETGILYQNGTIFRPIVTAFGKTDDGVDFTVTLTGVGDPNGKLFARVVSRLLPVLASVVKSLKPLLLCAIGHVGSQCGTTLYKVPGPVLRRVTIGFGEPSTD